MKIVQLILQAFLTLNFCYSQTSLVPVTFIVEDSDTHMELPGALVTVRQTALTLPTLANGKVKFDNVPVGEIEFYISKEGYQFETGRRNVSSEIKTNNFRISISKLDDKKILVTGEISDAEGRDLKDALVEVKIADQIKTVMSDAGGNYTLDIAPSTKFPTTTMRIEVKKGDCKKTETVDIPRTNVVYRDIKLDCGAGLSDSDKKGQSKIESIPIQKYEKGPWTISVSECKQSGNKINCSLTILNNTSDADFCILTQRGSRIFTHSGYEYALGEVKLADKFVSDHSEVYKRIIKGIPIKATLTFVNVSESVDSIVKMDVDCRDLHGLNYFSFTFEGVPVKK